MTEKPVILVIEDDRSIQKFLAVSLKTNGFDYELVKNGIDGVSLFMTNNPDLIILDLGLPDIDGMDVLRQIRESSDVPVIVVSARSRVEERVEALDSGADDYVTKPFHMNELLARVRVALRKRQPLIAPHPIFTFLDLVVDNEKRAVSVRGQEVHLTPMEYKLLLLLIKNSGKVLTHSYINLALWGHNNPEDSQSLRVCMANLRRKIEADSANPRYIMTEIGVGYRFNEN